MKIAVLSDTHIKTSNISTLQNFLIKLPKVDMILHCGDLISYQCYSLLESYYSTVAVFGNVDDSQCKEKLKEKEILQLEGYNVGLFHGHGIKGDTLKRVKAAFCEESVDIVIFGHSHKPMIFTEKNVIYINPGSPFYKRKEKYYSYTLLDLEPKGISANMNFIK